jgi:hypothetical protein
MIDRRDVFGRDSGAAFGAAFCAALAEEVRAIAAGQTPRGEGLVWTVAVLTAGEPGLDHAVAMQRLIAALVVESGPTIWDHVRAGAGADGRIS